MTPRNGSGREMGAGHTPGPWRLDGSVVRGHNGKHERPICEIYRELEVSDQAIANARLIAAAPALFDALQAMLRRFDFGEEFWPDHPIVAARAAIARATTSDPRP